MEPLMTGLFLFGLYKATEKIWEKGFDAAWAPVDEELKKRFKRWAGKGEEAKRRTAFTKAADVARANTLRHAVDPQQAERILDALNGERDRRGAEALAEEAAKLMLFSAVPDVPRLTTLCQERLRWDALWAGETPPPHETVAAILSDFLTNLRDGLLDQDPYHDLIQREVLRTLRQIVTELRPVAYDDEATYRYQAAKMYRQLEFVGIPELKERRPITVEDIFIRLRTSTEGIVRAIKEAMDRDTISPLEVRILQLRDGLVGNGEPYSLEELALKFPFLSPQEIEGIEEIARSKLTVASVSQAHEAVQRHARLAILGDPGAGKTTLLKYLTVICAEGRAESELGLRADGAGSPLPIFIPLREFAAECAGRDHDYCLLDYLYTHARKHLMLNLPRGFFEEALEAGRCLVCLDGLDEVWAVRQRKTVSDAVKALSARFPRSRYVVTSRIVGYDEAPLDRRDFIHHTILPLEDNDIREFVRRWYAVRERDPMRRRRKANDLIATIKREPRIKALAANPLLLTIITLVHRIEAELPHERVKLYDKCVTALVDTWEEVKGLTIAEKQRPFYRYRRRLLERLAYELHTRAEEPGQLQTVKAGNLELLVTRFLMENRRLGLADDPDGACDEARAFIRLARGRTGLLVERGAGVFGFPHLTFQEYLTACDIEKRCMPYGVNAVWEKVKDHLHDPNWREVTLLLLGSLNRYEDAPTLLVERILGAGEEDKFEPVFHRHLYLVTRALADRVDVADDLHRRVVDAMLEIVREAPWWERKDAFSALSWLEEDRYAAERLLGLALDPQVEPEVRSAAASTLGQLGRTEEAAEVLLALAHDPQVEARVRSAAASTLGQLGRTEEAAEVLLALAHDPRVEARVRSAAAEAVGQLGRAEEAVETLLALARDPQVGGLEHHFAANALWQLGCVAEAMEILLGLVCDSRVNPWVRSGAASALGQLGRPEEVVLDSLLSLVHDPQTDAGVRHAAALALGQLGRSEEVVLGSLLSLACDCQMDAQVRSTAAETLGQLGRAEEVVLDSLLALARDPQVDYWVRSSAASALGKLGCTEDASNVLLALACESQVEAGVRSEAASALGELGRAEEAAEVLLALARDLQVEAGVRRAAAETLGQLGRAEEAAEVLLALARDPQTEAFVRGGAAQALGQLGRAEETVLDGLLALTRDSQVDYWVRGIAASALGQLGRPEETVLDGLLSLACDEKVDAGVRSQAYKSLKRLAGGAVEPLKP